MVLVLIKGMMNSSFGVVKFLLIILRFFGGKSNGGTASRGRLRALDGIGCEGGKRKGSKGAQKAQKGAFHMPVLLV